VNTNTTPESFSQDLLRKARQRFLGARNPHPTCHLIKVIDVEVSIDGAPVHLYRGISIDQVRLKEYRYRVVLHTVGIILCPRINTPLHGLDTVVLLPVAINMLPIYIFRLVIYIRTKQNAFRIK